MGRRPRVKETPLEKLLRTMRDKRKRDADKAEKARIKAAVTSRIKRVNAEKKEKQKSAVTERNIRKDLFKGINAEIEKEKKDQKKAEEELKKKMRTEKKSRIDARVAEAKELSKQEKVAKKGRIKQEKVDKRVKAKQNKEMKKREGQMLKNRLDAKKKKEAADKVIADRAVAVEEKKKRVWDDQKLASLLIDSY
jgi:K+-transporting ATPase c subunit